MGRLNGWPSERHSDDNEHPLLLCLANSSAVTFRIRYRRLLMPLVIIALAGFLVWHYRAVLTTDELIAHEQQLRELVVRHPVQTVALGFVVFTMLSLIPGLTGKATVVGWIFGFWGGLVIVHFGLLLAGLIEFWFTRYYFHEFVESRFGYYLVRLNEALKRDGAYYLLMLRMAHMPYTVTNYAMGATSLTTPAFLWATGLGMLPSNALFVYAGSRVPTLGEIVTHGPGSILSPGFVIALLLIGLLPLAGRKLFRRSPEE